MKLGVKTTGCSSRSLRTARAERMRRTVSLPDAKYRVIYADPPWRYDHVETESCAVENQYPDHEADRVDQGVGTSDGRVIARLIALYFVD